MASKQRKALPVVNNDHTDIREIMFGMEVLNMWCVARFVAICTI